MQRSIKSSVVKHPGRSGLHAPGERLAHDLLALHDPGFVDRDRLDQQRHLRGRALPLGARLRHWSAWQAARVEVDQAQEAGEARRRRRARRGRRAHRRADRGADKSGRFGSGSRRSRLRDSTRSLSSLGLSRGHRSTLEDPEQQEQRGSEHRASDARSRPPRRGASRRCGRRGHRHVGHDQVRPLRHAPAEQDRGHRDHRPGASEPVAAGPDGDQRADPRDRRQSPRTGVRLLASPPTARAPPSAPGRDPPRRGRRRPRRQRALGRGSRVRAPPRLAASPRRSGTSRPGRRRSSGRRGRRRATGARSTTRGARLATSPFTTRMRPLAIEPAAAPSTNGVTSEAIPKTRVQVRCQAESGSPWERNANAEPRNTIPTSASENGT